MSGVRHFTELQSWQRARKWSAEIFRHTQNKTFAKDQRLVVQINDSSESVMSNIAEGFGRGTQAQFVAFLGYAIGSLDETHSHLCAAYDRAYLTKDEFARLYREGTVIRKLIVAFILAMIMPRGGVRSLGKRPSWSNQVWEIYERVTGGKRPAMAEPVNENGAMLVRTDEPPV